MTVVNWTTPSFIPCSTKINPKWTLETLCVLPVAWHQSWALQRHCSRKGLCLLKGSWTNALSPFARLLCCEWLLWSLQLSAKIDSLRLAPPGWVVPPAPAACCVHLEASISPQRRLRFPSRMPLGRYPCKQLSLVS